MNTAFEFQLLTRSAAARILSYAIVLGAPAIPAMAGAKDDKPIVMNKVIVDETKTHTLYMGADIAVSLGKKLYPVRGVVGSSWVIDVDGEEKVVSTRRAALSLKITPNLKLTDVSATVAGYKKERAYSFNNDPSVRLTRGLSDAAMTDAYLQDNASDAQHIVDTIGNKALGAAGLFATSDNTMGAAGMLQTAVALSGRTAVPPVAAGNYSFAQAMAAAAAYSSAVAASSNQNLQNAQQTASADLGQTQNGDEPGGRLVQTGLDAMDVEFEISSNRPLQKPYVVTLTRFHPKGSKPGTVQNLVYAKELHSIDAHPANVHFVEGGFPYDFELIDFQLHVYNKGEEVATTVSSKRVELTREEAFEYIKIEYIGAHKGDTLPAVPAMGKLPSELRQRLAEGKYGQTYYVRVSKDGLAGEAFLDADCTKKADDSYLNSVVSGIRFKPALAQGKPVEGVASLNLKQLKI